MGAMLGLVAALGYLTLAYLLDVRIRDDEDITEYFDQPLLGQIPAFNQAKQEGYETAAKA